MGWGAEGSGGAKYTRRLVICSTDAGRAFFLPTDHTVAPTESDLQRAGPPVLGGRAGGRAGERAGGAGGRAGERAGGQYHAVCSWILTDQSRSSRSPSTASS